MIIILIRVSMLDRGVMEIVITIVITAMSNHPHENYDNGHDNNDAHEHEGDDDDDDDDDVDDEEEEDDMRDEDEDENVDGDGDGDGDGNNRNYGEDEHGEILCKYYFRVKEGDFFQLHSLRCLLTCITKQIVELAQPLPTFTHRNRERII